MPDLFPSHLIGHPSSLNISTNRSLIRPFALKNCNEIEMKIDPAENDRQRRDFRVTSSISHPPTAGKHRQAIVKSCPSILVIHAHAQSCLTMIPASGRSIFKLRRAFAESSDGSLRAESPRSKISNLMPPAPASRSHFVEFLHARSSTHSDRDLANCLDLVQRSTVVQRPFQMPFELRVDLYTGQQGTSIDRSSSQTSCGMRPASSTKLLSAADSTFVLLRM